jgi:NTE family protein
MTDTPTMTKTKTAITNLVFEGGGAKGSAYAGCIEVLDSLGGYKAVSRVAGTSAGAITASLLACGAGSKGLSEAVYKTDFNSFIADKGGKVGGSARIPSHYGMHTGDGLVSALKENFQRFAGNSDLSFAQLETLVANDPTRFKSLSVVASNLNQQRPQVFDAHNNPALPIWQAVRASLSIPLIFEPMKIDGDYYVDGGLVANYPIDLYDEAQSNLEASSIILERNPATLGFFLASRTLTQGGEQFNPASVSINSLKDFAMALGSYLTENANAKSIYPQDKARTVFIDDLDVKATDFSVQHATIEALIESGRAATRAWFAQESPQESPQEGPQPPLQEAG